MICLRSYRWLSRWAMPVYWLAILLLVAVLIPGIGSTQGWGARRWLLLGPFQFQPSEFAKLATILALASYLGRPVDELKRVGLFLRSLGLCALPFGLVLREPDLGSALMFLPVGLVMMFVAGVPTRFLVRTVGVAAAAVALLLADILWAPNDWQVVKLEPYQKRRLMVYFGRSFVPAQATEAERAQALRAYRDASHNVDQALISVGSGGLTGKGWRRGTQNALGYLPRAVAHNDFIFSVIAEESGFLGSVAVLGLYAVILFSGIRIAGQARDRLGLLLAAGVVALFFGHVFVNIGMNIRLMPVTGIPLPLLSYGGTSVVCSLVALGLLQNLQLHRQT
jgi:rod shape determining protein RodA